MLDARSEVGPVIADVIVLAEMKLPLLVGTNPRILVRLIPSFDDGYHAVEPSARLQHPPNLVKREPVIDVLEYVRHDHCIEAPATGHAGLR